MQIKKICEFLLNNGWELDEQNDYFSFRSKHNYGIDVSKEDGEIIVIDICDLYHIPLSRYSIYTLVGYLILHAYDEWHKNYKFK
jgi:hypothetical protein